MSCAAGSCDARNPAPTPEATPRQTAALLLQAALNTADPGAREWLRRRSAELILPRAAALPRRRLAC
jgi:hypothetical protein